MACASTCAIFARRSWCSAPMGTTSRHRPRPWAGSPTCTATTWTCWDMTRPSSTPPHDSIGHLGIFVSGSVGRKEHQEFAANIDVIDVLPAGIHRMQIDDHPDGSQEGEPTRERLPDSDPAAATSMKSVRSSVPTLRTIAGSPPLRGSPRSTWLATAASCSHGCVPWSRTRVRSGWSRCIRCAWAMNCGLTGIRSPPQYMRLRNTCATIVSPSPRPTLSCNCRRSFPPPSNRCWINSVIAATRSTHRRLTRCTACRWCRP